MTTPTNNEDILNNEDENINNNTDDNSNEPIVNDVAKKLSKRSKRVVSENEVQTAAPVSLDLSMFSSDQINALKNALGNLDTKKNKKRPNIHSVGVRTIEEITVDKDGNDVSTKRYIIKFGQSFRSQFLDEESQQKRMGTFIKVYYHDEPNKAVTLPYSKFISAKKTLVDGKVSYEEIPEVLGEIYNESLKKTIEMVTTHKIATYRLTLPNTNKEITILGEYLG